MATNLKPQAKPTLESLGLKQLIRPKERVNQNISILIQGPVGSGKTWFAQTMPDPTFIMTDMNVGSLVDVVRDPFYVTSWEEWMDKYRPAIDNRLLPDKSLILDTGGKLFTLLEQHIGKARGAGSGPEGWGEWGRFKSLAQQVVDHLTTSCIPTDNHPGYHVLMTMHEKTLTNEKGVITAIKPMMSSAFADNIGASFDCYFTAEQKSTKLVTREPGKPAIVTRQPEEYILHTVRYDDYRDVKDGRGGRGGIHKLPKEVPNDFPTVLKMWKDGATNGV